MADTVKYPRVFVGLGKGLLEALEARRKQEHRRTIADTARAIIERELEDDVRRTEADKTRRFLG